MADSSDGDDFKPPGLLDIISSKFLKPAKPKDGATQEQRDPNRILEGHERKAAVSGLDLTEIKWSKAGLVLSTVMALVTPFYLSAGHKTTKLGHGKTTAVAPDAILLGGVVLIFCALGFFALRRRKRSLLAFTFFVVGFGFTLILPPLGLAIILLGGWLMLRAFRMQKYGTSNSKMVAKEAAARPSRKARAAQTKAPVKPTGYKAPTANKRYTPKAPSKKKVTKPVD